MEKKKSNTLKAMVAAKNEAVLATKKAEQEKHQPGKRPVLEAIFGRDWQRVVMEKVATREGQQWLNRKVEAWDDEQDRIAAYTTSTVWTASPCSTPSFRGRRND